MKYLAVALALLGLLISSCTQPSPDETLEAEFRLPPACPSATKLTPIYTIQGEGAATPLAGQQVTTQGVVVGDFQESNQLRGFFLQDLYGDFRSATSDGLFVFTPSGFAVNAGDYVQVTGTASEFSEQTQLGNVTSLEVCASSFNRYATPVFLPVSDVGRLERYEGMLVTFFQPLTVTEVFNLGRFGEVGLSALGRLYHPNNGNFLGESAQKNPLRRILLDDGSTSQNPAPTPYLSATDTTGTRRIGDKVNNLTGILSYGFGNYRMQPTHGVSFQAPSRPELENVRGSLKVASFNVLNYFTTLGSRGASSPEELARQQAKIVAALTAINADVVGLIEIENNGDEALNDLVAALNAKLGANTYAAIETGTVGTDDIKVAIIYKPGVVTPEGAFQIDNNDVYSRPPVAQTFRQGDKRFTVVVNHFKSKGCGEATGDELDTGQGCYNALRTKQAQQLSSFVTTLQATDPDVLVIGDLNSYAEEDPIAVLETSGLRNMLKLVPPTERYSFVFNGESGTLDYALATRSLTWQVRGVTIWHINTDEPLVIDYNLEFKSDDRYAPTPFRSSDHDPVIVGLELR
jgi:predicted extracellular nuclease